MSLARHAVESAAFLAILAGPIPLALGLAAAGTGGRRGAARLALATATAWCVFQTAAALVLGSLGVLDLPGAIVAEGAMAVTGLVWLGRDRSLREAVRMPLPRAPLEWALLATAGLMGATLLVKVVQTPIVDHDSLRYHLSAVALWYQGRGLVPLEGFHYGARYPYGWELLATLFLLPFGDDFVLLIPNLVAWAVLGLGVYRLAVALGATRVPALAAATLALALPLVSKQVVTLHIDLALGAFFVAGLAFVLDFYAGRDLGSLAFVVAALGLVLGVKTSGVPYVVLLVVTLIALALVRPPRPTREPIAAPTILFALAGVGVGLFWYVRNLVQVGNPLGEIAVGFAGHVLFPGKKTAAEVAPSTLLHCFHLGSPEHWRVLFGQVARLLDGPFVALAPLAAVALPACVWPRDRAAPRIAVALLLPVTLLAYWSTPFSADSGEFQGQITPWIGEGFRYALPFLGVLAALAGLGAARLGRASGLVGAAAIGIALARTWSTTTTWIVAGGVGVALMWSLVGRLVPVRAVRLVTAAAVAVGVLAVSLSLRAQRDLDRRAAYGDVEGFLIANTAPDEVVGCAAYAPCYVLFGPTLARRVARIPWTTGEAAHWVERLNRRQIRLLAVAPLRADDWRAGRLRDAGFTPVWKHAADPKLTLYRRDTPQTQPARRNP